MEIRIPDSARLIFAVLNLSENVGDDFLLTRSWTIARAATRMASRIASRVAAAKSIEEIYANLLYKRGNGRSKLNRFEEEKLQRLKSRLVDDGVDVDKIEPQKPEAAEKETFGQSIEDGFGRAILHILKKQYPNMLDEMKEDPKYRENPAATIGRKVFLTALFQVQNNEQDAYDTVQDFLLYLVKSGFDFTAKTKTGKPGASTWKQALNNIVSNVRKRGQTTSKKKRREETKPDEEKYANLLYRQEEAKKPDSKYKFGPSEAKKMSTLKEKLVKSGKDPEAIKPQKPASRGKRNLTLDEAFGKRPEGGGDSEGGEGRMEDEGEKDSSMPGSTDDKAAMKGFMDLLESPDPDNPTRSIVPDLRKDILENAEIDNKNMNVGLIEALLFDFVMNNEGESNDPGQEDKTGGFLPGVKSNMGQASAFKGYLEEIADSGSPNAAEIKDVLNRRSNRWSGYIGKVRSKLLNYVMGWVESYLPANEYDELWDAMYGQMSFKDIEKMESSKVVPKDQSKQRGLDLRKVIRMEADYRKGLLEDKEIKEFEKLKRRLIKELREENSSLEEAVKQEKSRLLSQSNDKDTEWSEELKKLVFLKERKKWNLLAEPELDELNRLQTKLTREMRPLGVSLRSKLHDAYMEHHEEADKQAWMEAGEPERAKEIADQAIAEVDEAEMVREVLKGKRPESEEEAPSVKKERFPTLEERKRGEGMTEGPHKHDITDKGGVNPEKLPLRPSLEERLKAQGLFDELEGIEEGAKKKMSSIAMRVAKSMAA